MFFTHLGRIVAVVGLVVGAFQLFLGLSIATGFITPYEEALRQFARAKTSGQVIDRGIYIVLFAIAFGVLTEISYALRGQSSSVAAKD
jgi:hypothetical protein